MSEKLERTTLSQSISSVGATHAAGTPLQEKERDSTIPDPVCGQNTPASAVGAHHRRDRLFIVAYTNNKPAPAMRRQREAIAGQDKSWRDNVRGGADDAWRFRSIQGARGDRCRFKQHLRACEAWSNPSSVGRVADGIPARVDRLRCLGNAVVPQVAEVVGRVIMELDNDMA